MPSLSKHVDGAVKSQMLRLSSIDELGERQARRERYQTGRTHVPEADVLAAVLELLRLHPHVAWARRSNTGSGYLLRSDVYRDLVAAGHLQSNTARWMQFGVKGGADVSGMLRGGRLLQVECKSDRGKLSADQEVFGQAVNGGGGLWLVARSVDDVMRALA